MRSRIQSQDTSAIPLYAAMSYVGCMYQQSSPGRDLKSLALQQTRRARQAQNIPSPRHIYQVATLLLLAIVFYGKGELGEASDCLEKAISLSIDIGMNRVDLITELRDREFAELWKRTYWYLYIMAEALEDTGTNRDFR
jgi:Fungal specific transcription factor domain